MSANPIVPDLDVFEYRRLRDRSTFPNRFAKFSLHFASRIASITKLLFMVVSIDHPKTRREARSIQFHWGISATSNLRARRLSAIGRS